MEEAAVPVTPLLSDDVVLEILARANDVATLLLRHSVQGVALSHHG